MSVQPLYVYGVLTFTPGTQCADYGTGIDGHPVRLLEACELNALVSHADPSPVQRTRRNMLAHTAVLEKALCAATVLPLRFGTVAPDSEALRACIGINRSAFLSALHSVEGRVELGVKASWKPGHVFEHVIGRDQALRRLRDRLRSRPAGETYYDRIELGRRVELALSQLRLAEASAIMADLQPLADRGVELRPRNDDMILNHAFLVRQSRELEFDAAVQRIALRCADRMDFCYVGPVPPFNFVSLHAGWLTDRAMAEAAT